MPTTLEDLTHWLLTKGLHIVLVVLFAIVTTRLIRWIAGRISKRLTNGDERDATVRSETVKHGQAVASVISSVAIALLYAVVAVDDRADAGAAEDVSRRRGPEQHLVDGAAGMAADRVRCDPRGLVRDGDLPGVVRVERRQPPPPHPHA